jgi:branched-chain amino acid aminotransferase
MMLYSYPMQNAIINVNGQILNPESAKISTFDRGYLYGDSLYEVIRTYGGKIYGMEEHLERLETSAELCHMKLNQSRDEYTSKIHETLRAFQTRNSAIRGAHPEGSKEAYIRLIVTRGVGKIGFAQSCVLTPTQYVVIVQPLEPPTETQFTTGMKARVVDRLRNNPRALDPAMKSGNYLNSVLAFLEGAREGFDDALMCNEDGFVTEGTTFNVFYVKRGIIVTPPLDIGILDGITRREVMRAAREFGIEVREARFPKERLYEADEVFLTSTIKEVFPITQVDGHKIGKGPGPMTRILREAFGEYVQRVLRAG